MAIIKLKRSETAATAPASLQYGEVAINITDKKIYIGNSSGATTLLSTTTEQIQDAAASLFTSGTHTGISVSYPDTNNAINLVNTGVLSFNTRIGAVSLTSSDVTTALGFTPISGVSTETIQDAAASLFTTGTHTGISVSYPDTNNAINLTNTGVLSFNTRTGAVSLTSGDVTTALGFTPTAYTAPTLGSTTLTSGTTITTVAGLSSVTSTSFVGALTGNASTVTNGVYTTDTGTVTNTMLAGSIANNKLTNSSITVNGSSISLGGSATVTATATNALTLGAGLTGTSYNGSALVTAAVDTATIATRAYVDTVAQGLHTHATAKTATTATLATLTGATVSYAGGAITWTGGNAANGASFNDGTTLTANTTEASADRILVKNEGGVGGLGASKNGTYYVYGARELRRTSDGDAASDWLGGDFCFITSGTLYADTGWVQTEVITTLDTDSIIWQQFSGAGSFTADETTLTLSGTQFSIKNTYVGQTSITTLGTIATGTWSATAIGATKGGTGLTTYALGDLIYGSAANTLSALTGNTTTTKKFLSQTGTGTVSAVPSWDTVSKTDVGLSNVENTALSTWAGSTNITTLGTIATGTWNASTIGETRGGTGQTTYATGDLLYSSATNTLSKLAKPASLTSFLQMTAAGVPSWTSTIPTTNGGTGLTSFTSKGLLYASSSSALTTGSEFYITESTGLAQSRRFNVDSIARMGLIGYKVSETTVGGTVSLGIFCDANDGTATTAEASLLLTSAGSISSFITLNNDVETNSLTIALGSSGAASNTIISGYLNNWDANYQIIEVIDNVATPYIIFGPDTNDNYIKMNIDSATTEIKATTLKINTSTPSPGMVLTCTDSDGTTQWQDSTGSTLALFNSGII